MAEWLTEFEERTTEFALRIIKMYSALPRTVPAQTIGKQVLRSGTSVGAHVAEANHRSHQQTSLPKLMVTDRSCRRRFTGFV
jgi:four helix bundle protein